MNSYTGMSKILQNPETKNLISLILIFIHSLQFFALAEVIDINSMIFFSFQYDLFYLNSQENQMRMVMGKLMD